MNNDLTKIDQLISWIEKNEFTISLDGYNVYEIDEFVKKIISWVKVINSDNEELKQKMELLEKELFNKTNELNKAEFEIQRYKTTLKQLEKVNDERKPRKTA